MKNNQPGSKKPIPEELLQPYEKSPIYRTAEDLLVKINSLQARMDKRHKYSTGARLTECVEEVADRVAWAYIENTSLKVKVALLQNAIKKTVSLLIKLRSANRLGLVYGQLHIELVTNCVSIIKQAQGWINKVSQPSGGRPEREPHKKN